MLKDGEFRRGHCVYEAEVKELIKRLEAKGVVLIVVKGKRNIDEVEVSAGVPLDEVQFAAKAMVVTGFGLINQLKDYVDKVARGN